MEFSIPTNWQESVITFLESKGAGSEVTEVYGKLPFDFIGGGRPASSIAFISTREAQAQIKRMRRLGIKFNYLLNALCLDNLEFSRQGQKKMHRLVDWLTKIEVHSVTVANTYIAMWLKKNYPALALSASVMAEVNSLNKAKIWEDIGVEKITFPASIVNRDFKLIRSLRRCLKLKIQLIANNGCLTHCPAHINHLLMDNHASQQWHKCRGYMFDYHLVMCRYARLKNPELFIRSDWIRPEDVGFYEELGVDSLKLVDRRFSAKLLLAITSAYLARSYEGNFFEFLNSVQGKTFDKHRGWFSKVLTVGNIFSMHPLKIMEFSRMLSLIEVSVNNRDLDGFVQHIPAQCDLMSCATCGYCASVARRAVKIDAAYLEDMRRQYAAVIEKLFKNGLSFF